MRRFRVPFFFLVFILIPLITFFVIQLAKGYRLDLQKKKFTPQGILVATSVPDGASVFINSELKTATNNTISLPPGDYKVEIKKDGFFSWTKNLKIEKELVTKTETFLFPKAPELRPLTFLGAQTPLLSPDGTKVIYSVPLEEPEKAGLWLLDLVEFPLGIIPKSPRQIVRSTLVRDFSQASISWSPDSRQILVSLRGQNFLLDPTQFTPNQNLINISWNLKSISQSWQKEKERQFQAKIKNLPPQLEEILATSAANLIFSPDEQKLLYQATGSATIPENLIPPLPASSTQPQERNIEPKNWYVYDLKEDKNFAIFNQQSTINNPPTWFFTSRHLILAEKDKISIVEYDGTNLTPIFSGPFENSYIFPGPNSAKIIILTSFGQPPNQLPNLYSINLR